MSALTDFCEDVLDSVEKHHLSDGELELGLEIISVIVEKSTHPSSSQSETILPPSAK